MSALRKLFTHLRERFTDWSPSTVQVTPAAGTQAPKPSTTKRRQSKEPKAVLWRFAQVLNPKTETTVWLEVRANGCLFKADAARLGVDHATEWYEVRAVSRAEARKLIAEGKAERRTSAQ